MKLKSLPLVACVVTSPFGKREFGGMHWHCGIDLRAAEGTPALAAADGTVALCRSDPDGYGLYIAVDHGSFCTLYAHLSSFAVAPGQQVRAGNTVGLTGNSGLSTGPHLHFEIRIGEYKNFWDYVYDRQRIYVRCVDPEPFIGGYTIHCQGQEAERTVQEQAGLEDKTMEFLKAYKYSEDLLLKLAWAMG